MRRTRCLFLPTSKPAGQPDPAGRGVGRTSDKKQRTPHTELLELVPECNTLEVRVCVCVSVSGTHMTLQGREVDVGDEKHRLSLQVGQHLKDGDVVAFLEDGHFDIHD